MTETTPNGGSSAVSTRELYTQINALRSEMNARLDKIDMTLDTRFEKHDNEHQQAEWRRASRLRWAVTTILSALGIGAAIVIPLIVR